MSRKTDIEYGRGNEHPEWSIEDWQYDVRNGDTILGYNDWVHHNTEH